MYGGASFDSEDEDGFMDVDDDEPAPPAVYIDDSVNLRTGGGNDE